jgi:metallo-beta-lactamase family protein
MGVSPSPIARGHRPGGDCRRGALRKVGAMATIQFLGAAGTVTGSKFLVDAGPKRFMVDCGMFQGAKKLRLLNWSPLPVNPASISDIFVTHAHIDHMGMIPVFVRDGFAGSVWATPATVELCEINLHDAAHLQEEDANFANKKGFSKHTPALPLFNTRDVERSLARFKPLPYDRDLALDGQWKVTLRNAGHVLGSAMVQAEIACRRGTARILFSGDLGRAHSIILEDPERIDHADYLVIESTYGDRMHPAEETSEEVAGIVRNTAARGGSLVVPAFALGRTQQLLYIIRELKARQAIPDLPVYLDSPMAAEITEVFCRHIEEFNDEARRLFHETGQCPILCPNLHITRTPEESKKINDVRFPCVIISGSGMATGGRVLHHLKNRLPDPRNAVLFIGFQTAGTRGQLLKDGAREIKIHGEMIPVRARILSMESFSRHADAGEILKWLSGFKRPPKMTFVVHGEPGSSSALAERIRKTLGWKTHIPEYLETTHLD